MNGGHVQETREHMGLESKKKIGLEKKDFSIYFTSLSLNFLLYKKWE